MGGHRIVIAVPTKKQADRVFDFVRNELNNAGIKTRIEQQDDKITRRERASDALLEAVEGVRATARKLRAESDDPRARLAAAAILDHTDPAIRKAGGV